MRNKIPIFLILILLAGGCMVFKRGTGGNDVSISGMPALKDFCDSTNTYSSLFIGKIDTRLEIDGDRYDGKISVFYIPDSLVYLSATNSGFEIIRALLVPDSLVVINRLDKIVYLHRNDNMGNEDPLNFQDVEYLINRYCICQHLDGAQLAENRIFFNRSGNDVKKLIYYDLNSLKLERFEFYQKVSHEYIVGERSGEDAMVIFSDYIIDEMKITGSGGEVEFNKELDVDMKVNERKYITIEI